jgi:hypothetical protein
MSCFTLLRFLDVCKWKLVFILFLAIDTCCVKGWKVTHQIFACKKDMFNDAFPSFWIDSNVSLKWKQRKSQKLGHIPWLATLGGGGQGRGACWSSKMGLGRMTSAYSLTWTCTKPNNKLVGVVLEHFWC